MPDACGLAAEFDSGAAAGASTGTEALGARAILEALLALRVVSMGVRSLKPDRYLQTAVSKPIETADKSWTNVQ